MGIFCFSKAPHSWGGVIYSRVTMDVGKPSEGKAIILITFCSSSFRCIVNMRAERAFRRSTHCQKVKEFLIRCIYNDSCANLKYNYVIFKIS